MAFSPITFLKIKAYKHKGTLNQQQTATPYQLNHTEKGYHPTIHV
jgi:hypothetical protein